MTTKGWMIGVLALAISAPVARAQEEWGERRGEYMRELRIDCDSGDERACERLRRLRHEWREDRGWDEHELREDRGWHEREHEHDEQRDRSERPTPTDPKVALCLAIENNYNNCIKQQQARQGQQNGCVAWVVQLKANHCF
jgi:hypothetical protein